MRINETLCLGEPSDVLGQETGIFLLSSPSGEVQTVVCHRVGMWSVRQRQFFPESVRSDSAWRITKIAEKVPSLSPLPAADAAASTGARSDRLG